MLNIVNGIEEEERTMEDINHYHYQSLFEKELKFLKEEFPDKWKNLNKKLANH